MSLLQVELKLSDLTGKIDLLVGEIKQCREGMDFMNIIFEQMKAEWKKIVGEQLSIQKENVELKKELKEIRREISFMKMNIESEEKTKTLVGLELSQIPEKKDEKLDDLIIKIGKTVNFSIKKENIKSIYRKKNKGKIGDVILMMDSVPNRDGFLKEIKKKKLSTKDLGYPEASSPIYVRELLTKYGKDLYFSALKFKREKSWKFLWINEGRVLLREKEGEKYHVIRHMEDIERLRK